MVVKRTSIMKASPARVTSTVQAELSNYVDDTGKVRLDRSNAYFMEPDERAEFRSRQRAGEITLAQGTKILAPAGFSRGEIQLEGFLAARALQRGLEPKAPAPLEQRQAWVRGISQLWKEELFGRSAQRYLMYDRARKRTVALKFVFSPPQSDIEALRERSVSPISVLRRCMLSSWKHYEQLHGLPQGSVGFAWAVHLDNDVLHAHTLVFPLTQDGARLKVSNRHFDSSISARRDHLTEFRTKVSQSYQDERRIFVDAGPRASLPEQLTRAVGCRIVTGLARGKAPDAFRAQALALATVEFSSETSVMIPADEVGPTLSRWVSEASRRSAPKEMPRGSDGQRETGASVDYEGNWWRWLWISLEWRRRRREAPEHLWPEFAAIAEALAKGTTTGPGETRLPAIMRRAAQELRPEIPLAVRAVDPVWAIVGRVRVNEWLNQTREILLRSLVIDTFSVRAGRDPILRLWFGKETLRYDSVQGGRAPAMPMEIDQPLRITRDLPERGAPRTPGMA